MVRKKRGVGSGKIYAMKVLKKSVIASLGQIEHTKAEQVYFIGLLIYICIFIYLYALSAIVIHNSSNKLACFLLRI